MRQAQTLNEAQFRRVLHYCRSRRHPVRDTTIFMVSFYAGLSAKEIAALKLGDVFDETGAVRDQFILGCRPKQRRAAQNCVSQSTFEKSACQIRQKQMFERIRSSSV